MRCAAYIRVSLVGDRAETLVSPDGQLNVCRELAKARGWDFDEDLSRECIDLDESAYKQAWSKRPGLRRLVEAAKRGEITAIIAYRQDRIARNGRDLHDLLDVLESCGSELLTSDLQIDTSTPMGQMMRTFLGGMAQMESANISDRVRLASRTRAEMGRNHGGMPPVWLSYDKATKTYTVKEETADAMRLMARMRAQGHGFTSIVRAVNAAGYRRPGGRPWNCHDASEYLRPDWLDTMATGAQYAFRPSRRKTRNGKALKRGETIRVEGIYPPILDQETADIAAAVQTRTAKIERKATGDTYILSGLLRCSKCGDRMRGKGVGTTKNGSTKKNYLCIGFGAHDGGNVNRDMLENAVVSFMGKVIERHGKHATQPVRKPEPKDMARLLKSLNDRLERLNTMFELGNLTVEDYTQRAERIREERQEIEKPVEDVPAVPEPITEDMPRATVKQVLRQHIKSITYPHYDERVTTLGGELRPMAQVVYRVGLYEFTAYLPMYRKTWTGERKVYFDDELYGVEEERQAA